VSVFTVLKVKMPPPDTSDWLPPILPWKAGLESCGTGGVVGIESTESTRLTSAAFGPVGDTSLKKTGYSGSCGVTLVGKDTVPTMLSVPRTSL
jgi:hypothetical protein